METPMMCRCEKPLGSHSPGVILKLSARPGRGSQANVAPLESLGRQDRGPNGSSEGADSAGYCTFAEAGAGLGPGLGLETPCGMLNSGRRDR